MDGPHTMHIDAANAEIDNLFGAIRFCLFVAFGLHIGWAIALPVQLTIFDNQILDWPASFASFALGILAAISSLIALCHSFKTQATRQKKDLDGLTCWAFLGFACSVSCWCLWAPVCIKSTSLCASFVNSKDRAGGVVDEAGYYPTATMLIIANSMSLTAWGNAVNKLKQKVAQATLISNATLTQSMNPGAQDQASFNAVTGRFDPVPGLAQVQGVAPVLEDRRPTPPIQTAVPVGTDVEAAEPPDATLLKLKSLLDAGVLTQEEFDNKKAEILKRF